MKEHIMRTSIAIALCVIVVISLSSGLAAGADCQKIIKDIEAERNFLLRKDMVKEGVAQCSDNANLVFKYAFSLERFNEPEEALKYYKKAAQLDPNMAMAYFGMGDIYKLLKRHQEALDAFNKGLQIDPTNVRAIKCRLKMEELVKAGE